MSKEKLIETAKKILALPHIKNKNIKMRKFDSCVFELDNERVENVKNHHTCGTAFCIVGWLAAYDDFPKQYREYYPQDNTFSFDYINYSEELTNYDTEDLEWQFLFYDYWPDSLAAAKKRAQYVIDNEGAIPPIEKWVEDFGFTSPNQLP